MRNDPSWRFRRARLLELADYFDKNPEAVLGTEAAKDIRDLLVEAEEVATTRDEIAVDIWAEVAMTAMSKVEAQITYPDEHRRSLFEARQAWERTWHNRWCARNAEADGTLADSARGPEGTEKP